MKIHELAALIVPIATAAATLIPVLKATFDSKKAIESKLDVFSLDIQRLTLHDEHLAIEERLEAGQRYLDLGGNGATRVYYENLAEQYKKELWKRNEGK